MSHKNHKAVLITEGLLDHDVVCVLEDGTADAFSAYYVDGKLIVENPRGDTSNMLDALGIRPRVLLVPYGFDGHFPALLKQLKTYSPPA